MAHVEKYTAGAVGRLSNHYGRKEGDGVNRGNECIDSERTKLKYNLAHCESSQLDRLHQRLKEVRVQKRKDVNIMCDWVVTAPQDLKQSDTHRFFEVAYQFLSERYGKENVISAYVHLDETTPHMHFAFVPVVEDKKKGGLKVSAKELLNRTELRNFHGELSDYVEKALGYQVGILNGQTVKEAQNVAELKRIKASQELEKKKNLLRVLQSQEKALTELLDTSKDILPIPAVEYSTKGFINRKEIVSMPESDFVLLRDMAIRSAKASQYLRLADDSFRSAIETVSGEALKRERCRADKLSLQLDKVEAEARRLKENNDAGIKRLNELQERFRYELKDASQKNDALFAAIEKLPEGVRAEVMREASSAYSKARALSASGTIQSKRYGFSR